MAIKYADVAASRVKGNPRPRLDQLGYTLRGGSPTTWQVQLRDENRWRRVYVICFSNSGSHFVKTKNGDLYLAGDFRELEIKG